MTTKKPRLKARQVEIGGEVYDVDDVRDTGFRDGTVHEITAGRLSFYVAESSEEAGKAAREYWQDMADNDPREFACLVGEETLIQWGMGHSAGPGSTHVNNLGEWLDLWLDTPEEHWASYDGTEQDIRLSRQLAEEVGFRTGVAYRHN